MKIVSLFASLLLLLPGLLSAKPIAPPEFDTPQKRLHFFTHTGNLEGVDAALDEGADVNAVGKYEYPLLHISIFQDNQEVFDHLLKNGADIHMFSDFGNCNALSLATVYDRREMVLKLLEAGADPNAAEEERYMKEYSAIAYAALYGHIDLLKLFAARGGDLERPLRWPMWRRFPAEFPLLSVAAQHGGLDVVRYLVEERGHAVNPTGKIPVLPPLSVAVRYNNRDVAKYLISKGADVNAVGHDYFYTGYRSRFKSNLLSPLGVAARYNRVEMIELLFASGAKVREDVKEYNHPLYWADWAGYSRVIEAFEKNGYTFDKWASFERRFRESKTREKANEVESNASEFTPTFLKGHKRKWHLDGIGELSKPLRLAVIADEQSQEIADLLTASLSGKKHLVLVERSKLDAVLKEQQLNYAGLAEGESLSQVSELMNAQALVLINTVAIDKKEVFQFRLVNSILGLQFGRNYIENEESTILPSMERYAATVGALAEKFRRDYEYAIPISLVNVRSDLGTVVGLKVENTLKRLLELELLAQPSVLLTQRKNLETLIREKDLGGREEEFRASSIFVDIGANLDAKGEHPESYTLRVQPASGGEYTLELPAEGRSLEESAALICRSLMARIDRKYVESKEELRGELGKDVEAYINEALWHFDQEQFAACLEPMRTAISLGYDERYMWDYYYWAIEEVIENHWKHRGDDVNNRHLLALERERLVVLEGILKFYRSDVPARALRAPGFSSYKRGWLDTGGLIESLQRFRPVAMQQRYAEELKSLERQILRLVNDYLAPCYTDPMPHGRLPVLRENNFLKVIDLMTQLKRAEYIAALENLMHAYRDGRYKDKHFSAVTPDLPIGESEWNSVALEFSARPDTFVRSIRKIYSFYRGGFDHKWEIPNPLSVVARQELVDFMRSAANSPVGEGDALLMDSMIRKSFLYELLRLHRPQRFLPREGLIPIVFQKYDADEERRQIELALLRNDHSQKFESHRLNHIKSVRFALEGYEAKASSDESGNSEFYNRKIRSLKERLDSLRGLTEEEEVVPGKLAIRLWSLEVNASPEFGKDGKVLHEPVIHDGKWLVLASISRPSENGTKNVRNALLEIDPETLETKTRWIGGQLLRDLVKVAKAGNWLAIARRDKPIKILNLETLEIQVIPGYIPTRSPATGYADVASSMGRFFLFVQPESMEFGDLYNPGNSRMQIMLCYDPETGSSEVVYNTRRNPSKTVVDGTGSVFYEYGRYKNLAFHNALVINDRSYGSYYWVDAETLEVTNTSMDNARKMAEQNPFRFARSVTLNDLEWGDVHPGIHKEERAKLPLHSISAVLQSYQGERKKARVRKAVLPLPEKEDPNYRKFDEKINEITNSTNPKMKRQFRTGSSLWFGESYGCIVYKRRTNVLWGIFKMSDLAEALKNSPEL